MFRAQRVIANLLAGRRLECLERVEGESANAIAAALTAARADSREAPAHQGKASIERIRADLLQRTEPLADGSLGVPGPYDAAKAVSDVCRVSKPVKPANFLYHLVLALQPRKVIELGTNLGISAAYIGAALGETGQGSLMTLEASPYRTAVARDIHARLGLANIDYRVGLFSDSLGPALAELGDVDMAFIDGHHQLQPTLDYFEQVYERSNPGAVFVFDDIRWSDGMWLAWKRLRSDRRLALAVDCGDMGVCAAGSGAAHEGHSEIPLVSYAA
jgi:predicted O-methyltransferase YrrM